MPVTGFELLASGMGRRLERWGDRIVMRPETAATWDWPPGVGTLPDWDGLYHGSTASGGHWEWRNPLPDPCIIRCNDLSFLIRPTASKHLGLFPEQAENWVWISSRIGTASPAKTPFRILNLFGYTGGSTLAAAAAGASVTHVDSSKAMVSWCSDNARLSGLGATPIRYIVEDSMTFLQREIRRGNQYDAIIMDPPSYGRGKGGELWKLEEHLPLLLEAALTLLSEHPLFLLLNTYSDTVDSEAASLVKTMTQGFFRGSVATIPLGLTGSIDGKFLPLGRAHRWTPGA
jgi:23S rRNA (cytosine1962-C5)-methyltransferase